MDTKQKRLEAGRPGGDNKWKVRTPCFSSCQSVYPLLSGGDWKSGADIYF